MSPQEAYRYLESFDNFEKELHHVRASQFTLKRIEHLLKLLDDPHLKIKTVHVAGSKGKGSTCAFLSSILRSAGYKVGLYTSPHLYDLRERIRVLNGKPRRTLDGMISEKKLCATLEKIRPAIEKVQTQSGALTYFEVLTALAFQYFYDQKVDMAVLETGLGGRLDATNVVRPLVCALTPIGLEHTRILGKTLSKIAYEKAAIIKVKGQRVVVAPQAKDAAGVISRRCKEFGARVFWLKKNFQGRRDLKISLPGAHQVMNARVAMMIAELLKEDGFVITSSHCRRGLRQTFWPGRFEIVQKKPLVILDCAHTQESSKALVETVQEIFPDKRFKLILGLSQDKDVKGVCAALNPITAEVVFTRAHHPRALKLSRQRLQKFFPGKSISVTDNMTQALKGIATSDAVVITGSIFIVAEARGMLRGR